MVWRRKMLLVLLVLMLRLLTLLRRLKFGTGGCSCWRSSCRRDSCGWCWKLLLLLLGRRSKTTSTSSWICCPSSRSTHDWIRVKRGKKTLVLVIDLWLVLLLWSFSCGEDDEETGWEDTGWEDTIEWMGNEVCFSFLFLSSPWNLTAAKGCRMFRSKSVLLLLRCFSCLPLSFYLLSFSCLALITGNNGLRSRRLSSQVVVVTSSCPFDTCNLTRLWCSSHFAPIWFSLEQKEKRRCTLQKTEAELMFIDWRYEYVSLWEGDPGSLCFSFLSAFFSACSSSCLLYSYSVSYKFCSVERHAFTPEMIQVRKSFFLESWKRVTVEQTWDSTTREL